MGSLTRQNEVPRQRLRVAIIGTGLAGLTTAYLLQNDARKRYEVTLFEQADSLSFDAESVSVRNKTNNTIERVDLPMRASAGGYYKNLMRMYDHLGITLHPARFLFVFAKALPTSCPQPTSSHPETAGSAPGSYFVHASNMHQTPPPWPSDRPFMTHIMEIFYLVICHFWFSVACFLIQPRPVESFADYLARIWLPRRYISNYVLPMMSSVSTCTHNEMMAFPASDVTSYKKLSHGQHHYTVCGGIHQVQDRLVHGIQHVRLRTRVVEVKVAEDNMQTAVRWTAPGEDAEENFDRVVLAVSPDVAARIFRPLRKVLHNFPTVQVESLLLSPNRNACLLAKDDPAGISAQCSHHDKAASPAQVITFKTVFSAAGSRTEAIHTMPTGVVVSTCPLDADAQAKKRLHVAQFTRTLRTVESKQTIHRIMTTPSRTAKRLNEEALIWSNGENNVWLAGAWCWDGMVLLEGCVVSAMRVADDFGVDVPWR
ncbi:hypothetical protein V8C35DRAFT_279600 [Trichoderma chlorosporum]